MNHSVAIEALKDELEETRKSADYLSSGLTSMMLRRLASQRIREDAIFRWQSKLAAQAERLQALQASIAFLELHHTGGN
jgi:hypothetical protein